MAKKFLTHINLAGNQLLNAAFQPSAFAPSAVAEGQIYYNTNDNALYFSTGTGSGSWQQLATGTTSVASINSFIGAVTLNGTTNNITVNNNNNVITLDIGSNVVTLSDNQTLTNKTLNDTALGTNLDADGYKITNLGTPTSNYDAVTKKYVDDSITNVDLNILGTANQVVAVTDPGQTTLSLDTTVRVDNAIKIGTDLNSPAISLDGVSGEVTVGGNGVNGSLAVKSGDNSNRFTVDTNGRVNFYNSNGDNFVRIDNDTITGYQGLNINAYNAAFPGAGNLNAYAEQNTYLGAGANLEIYANDNNQGGDISLNASSGAINLNSDTYVKNKQLYVQDGSNVTIFQVDPANKETTIQGSLRFLDQNAVFEAVENINGNTEFNIAADYSIRINSSNGAVYLEPDTWAYINNDAIVTETHTQTLTNKTIGDNLHFENTGGVNSIGADGNDLNIVSNNGTINITSNSSNVILSADGAVYLGSANSGNEVVGRSHYITLENKGLANATLQSDLNAADYKITNLADPVNPQDAANKRYVDSATAGLTWKQAVNLLYNDPNPTLSGNVNTVPLAIDGHPALTITDNGYRILVISGNNAGIYVYNQDTNDDWTLTRATDADTYQELVGAAVFVTEGTQYGSTSWVQSNTYLTDFTGQSWSQFSGSGTYTAGDGLVLNGTIFSLNPTANGGLNSDASIKLTSNSGLQTTNSGLSVVTGEGLEVVNGAVKIQEGYVTRKITTTITGDAVLTSWNIEHNLNTYDVVVKTYQLNPNDAYRYSDVETDVIRVSENEIQIVVAKPLGVGYDLNVVIVG